MILTLTPNPAIDVTYEVPGFRARHEHRVATVRTAPGGKGVNTARVLAALGKRSRVLGPLGGASGQELRELLGADVGASRIDQRWTPVAGATRRTVTVLDGTAATGMNEPGPELTADERDRLHADLRRALVETTATARPGLGSDADNLAPDADPTPDPSALAVSGSLPRGLGEDDVARAVHAAHERGIPVLVDTSGPALLAAARAGADLLKPNRAEAAAATGEDGPLAACRALIDLGARAVVCSLGEEGMLLLERGADGTCRAHRASAGRVISGNPTGAGDAAVAELALGLAHRQPLPAVLARAVATSASAVARPRAGEIDADLRAQLLTVIVPEEIPCP